MKLADAIMKAFGKGATLYRQSRSKQRFHYAQTGKQITREHAEWLQRHWLWAFGVRGTAQDGDDVAEDWEVE